MPRLRLILAVLVTPLALPAGSFALHGIERGGFFEKHMVAEAAAFWPAYGFSLAAILLSVGLLMAYKRMLALFVILATATCADFVGILTAIWFRSWSVFTNIVELAEVLVVGAAFGAILGAIFCCMAGTPLSRTPLRPSRLLAVVSKLMAFGRAVAVLASIAFVPFLILVGDNGSIPLPRPGFSIAFQGTVQPTDGRLLGFAKGQSWNSAVGNACGLSASGVLQPIPRSYGLFSCNNPPTAVLDEDTEWSFRLKSHFHCVGLEPETLKVDLSPARGVDFIGIDCGQIIQPL